MSCAPPADCAGRSDGACRPPDFCTQTLDGRFDCKPPAPQSFNAAGRHGGPCGPPQVNSTAAAPVPCGPPQPMGPPPECQPGPDGGLRCAAPSNCGGAAFGGAGAAGCAPPDFCKQNAAGTFDCKPPEDCRAGPDGASRCAPPPVGAACQRMLQGEAASGAFVPCGAAPTEFCPPPPPGQPPKCGAPPAAPRSCVGDEPMFPPNHPPGTPPVCNPAPRIDIGSDGRARYTSPIDLANAGGNCVPPPPGEWPPAQPAPAPKVWCPPMGFAPSPPPGQGFDAWREFSKAKLPPNMQSFVFDQARKWDNVNESALADFTRLGAVNQMFAPPSFDGRMVNGSFASAKLDDGMRIRDFSVGGTPFFGDIKPKFEGNASFSSAAGTAVIAANDRALFETHNVPSGLMAYRGAGDPFPLRFEPPNASGPATWAAHAPPPGTAPRRDGAPGLFVSDQGDGWKGIIIGDVKVNGSALDATVGVGSPVFFMAIPPTGLESETRLDIAKGVADGQVFAEISLMARNETTAEDLTFYADADTFKLNVTEVTQDAITLDIGGEGDGQALVFTVDRETLTTPLSELNVTIDGQLINECATFDELTDSAAAGGCFHVVANETTLRVSVMPEHFSDHTIVIGAIQRAAAPVPEEDSATAPVETLVETENGDPAPAASPTPAASTPAPTAAPAETPAPGVFVIVAAIAAVALLFRRRNDS